MINHIGDPRLKAAKHSLAVRTATKGAALGFTEFTVMVPASQFVKVEALASERSRSLEATASFLLSEWVLATRMRKRARRSAPSKTGKRRARRPATPTAETMQ